MYDRILFPTDGGPATERALDHVAELAAGLGATVWVLYVVDESTIATELDTTTLVEQLLSEGNEVIEYAIDRLETSGVERVIGEVVRGTPAERILEYAAENDVDLIVMGTHGRTGLNRYLLGSVTERVVRQSDQPVLTVRRIEPS